MVSGYLRFAAPNMTSAGAILRATPRVNISDFAIACDQYYVYFTDDVRVLRGAIGGCVFLVDGGRTSRP